MSNLLLITDVARLRKIFGRLTEDKNIRLRVVNNLEKGGEEIAIEKPDVVFVQTHLSGLSPDILIMHLKKQLGRRRSRFVLLASPSQTSDAILKPYQGWLDTSAEDNQLISELQQLLITLLSKPKKTKEAGPQEPTEFKAHPASSAELSPLPSGNLLPDEVPPQLVHTELQLPAVTPPAAETSLEEQGITYAPRQRLSVYSEFTSSFDNAVSSTPEPEALGQATPTSAYDWDAEDIEPTPPMPAQSKIATFILWLAPVIIAAIVITYLQQQKTTPKPDQSAAAVSAPGPAPTSMTPKEAAQPTTQDQLSDKEVLTSIAENRTPAKPAPATAAGTTARPTVLPDFIPRYAIDKQFSTANPGWERYKGKVTEFKVLREDNAIKAIQIIDRGGQGVPESFMKATLRQVTKNPLSTVETTEKKEGYLIERGHIADNIRVVYYRDENGGKLRAMVLTWQ